MNKKGNHVPLMHIIDNSKAICPPFQPAKLHFEVINKVPPPAPPPTQTTSSSTSTPHHSPPTPTDTYTDTHLSTADSNDLLYLSLKNIPPTQTSDQKIIFFPIPHQSIDMRIKPLLPLQGSNSTPPSRG